jgi:DNA helicase-2/ATP-dependent DNA helicase PcrA
MTLHAAKGLEFPVVFMAAVEQGLLPHERSLSKPMELEEERRLCFVGMTRAKEELYLCHARLRDFRGSTLSVVPSVFLSELPEQGVQTIDSSGAGGRAAHDWRGGGGAAAQGWADAGVTPNKDGYALGMQVRHEQYGLGRVSDLSGAGVLRKIKIRFPTHGEKTFIVEKVKLEIVGSR